METVRRKHNGRRLISCLNLAFHAHAIISIGHGATSLSMYVCLLTVTAKQYLPSQEGQTESDPIQSGSRTYISLL